MLLIFARIFCSSDGDRECLLAELGAVPLEGVADRGIELRSCEPRDPGRGISEPWASLAGVAVTDASAADEAESVEPAAVPSGAVGRMVMRGGSFCWAVAEGAGDEGAVPVADAVDDGAGEVGAAAVTK